MPESLTELPAAAAGSRPMPVRRHRLCLIAGTIAGVALLAAGAAGCSSASSSGQPAASATAPAAHSPGSLSLPARIASLKKSADQGVARDLMKALKDAPGGAKLSAVVYEDSADGSRKVLIYGGVGMPVPPGGPEAQLKAMIRSGTRSGAKVGDVSKVDAGAVGGTAECALIPGGGTPHVNCGWINDRAALVMAFGGFDQQKAQALVPQILTVMMGG